MRIAIARAISTIGHPVVLISVAALIAASTQGATVVQLRSVGVFMLALATVVIGFMWYQVRSGRWTHVDASGPSERPSLNLFLVGLLALSALLLWRVWHSAHMSIALALAALLIVAALLISKWLKVSLHAVFAAYSTTLLWPLKFAVVAGIIVTAAVAWSRLALSRHTVAEIIVGLLLGAIAGGAYSAW
jgi:hypothetical protein